MSYSKTITEVDLTNILNEVLPSGQYIETLEYVGNYGQTIFDSSWTATDDGIMVEMLGSNTSGATAYWYINDTTENRAVGCISMNANGTTNSTCFPIIKGHTYSSSAKAAVNTANAYFFKYTLKETVPDSAVDYIVEQGTSGIWTYRKWNSGVAECWGNAVGAIPSGWSSAGLTHNLPFTFVTVKNSFAQFRAYQVARAYTTIQATNATSVNIQTNSDSAMSSASYSVSVKGTWK